MSRSILGFLLFALSLQGQEWIADESQRLFDEAVRIREWLHQIPETCYSEETTSAFVADYLRNCGLEVVTGLGGKRGIKAILKGSKAKPVIGIRADMDALPLEESTGLTWSSKNPGRMHACGHDIHMTNVLIAAKIASQRKNIPATLVFIFQPCEEGTSDGSPAGAELLVQQGVLSNPDIDMMLGLHVMPGYPVGTVAYRPGPIMANVASISIAVKGKSSHGAFPHQGIDAIYAASSAILQFQSLISRMKDPNEKAVLTIGTIQGGVRQNVIADRVDMTGTARSFSFETEKLIEQGIENILKGVSSATGVQYEYRFSRGSQYVKNDDRISEIVGNRFRKILGPDNVFLTEPVTIGEDFSFYSHAVPSFFFFLGAGESGTLHSPDFAPDNEILHYGAFLLLHSALSLME